MATLANPPTPLSPRSHAILYQSMQSTTDSPHPLSQPGRRMPKNEKRPVQFMVSLAFHSFTLCLVLYFFYRPSAVIFQVMMWIEFAQTSSPSLMDDMRTSCEPEIVRTTTTLANWVQPSNILDVMGYTVGFIVALIAVLKSWSLLGQFFYFTLLSIVQWIIVLYQATRIGLSMGLYTLVLVMESFHELLLWMSQILDLEPKTRILLRLLEDQSITTYDEWLGIATALDIAQDKEVWKKRSVDEDEPCDYKTLAENILSLDQARSSGDADQCAYVLQSCVKRNQLGMDSPSLHLECKTGSKEIIKLYRRKVLACITCVTHSATSTSVSSKERQLERVKKIEMLKKLKKSLGTTGLCLSGGGALAMYHLGTIKALLEANLLPNVISGSSGGAIGAAMLACQTNEELWNTVLKSDISTKYPNRMWFPPLWSVSSTYIHVFILPGYSYIHIRSQLCHFVSTGFLLDGSVFEQTTQHFFSNPLYVFRFLLCS